MDLDRSVLAFAVVVVLAITILPVTANLWWIALTIFAGASMLQASMSGFCPAAMVFKKIGVCSSTAFE